jgi:hypothetical protein
VLSPETASQDASGEFCRKWLPEIARLPNKCVLIIHFNAMHLGPSANIPLILCSGHALRSLTLQQVFAHTLEGAARCSCAGWC